MKKRTFFYKDWVNCRAQGHDWQNGICARCKHLQCQHLAHIRMRGKHKDRVVRSTVRLKLATLIQRCRQPAADGHQFCHLHIQHRMRLELGIERKFNMPSKHAKPDVAAMDAALPDWTEFPVLEEFNFEENATRYRELSDEIKALEDEKKALQTELLAATAVAEVKSVRCANFRVTRTTGRTPSQIVAERLLEHGVAMDVIEDSTEPGREYEYVQVKALGK